MSLSPAESCRILPCPDPEQEPSGSRLNQVTGELSGREHVVASDTGIAEGPAAQVALPTRPSLASSAHSGPQGLRFGELAVSRLKGVNMPFHI